jgi:ADP-ribose pyrophosphatase YjhB (NUDIX family)
MSLVPKAVPVLLREKEGRLEFLAFRHPKFGLQIVKGTVEPGEVPDAAALRELEEESGVTGARIVADLGTSDTIDNGQLWHFFHCAAGEQPARWVFATQDEGGLIFSFFWQPLDAELTAEWHYASARAAEFIRARLQGAGVSAAE